MDYRPPTSGRGLVKNSADSDEEDVDVIDEILLRQLVSEIIRRCDDDSWCLFTKKKDKRTGRRRRLGTHSSRSGAERQERAIKAAGG